MSYKRDGRHARVFASKIRAIVRAEPKAFAYDLGLSVSAVYNYMNGRVPTTEVLLRIEKVLPSVSLSAHFG